MLVFYQKINVSNLKLQIFRFCVVFFRCDFGGGLCAFGGFPFVWAGASGGAWSGPLVFLLFPFCSAGPFRFPLFPFCSAGASGGPWCRIRFPFVSFL